MLRLYRLKTSQLKGAERVSDSAKRWDELPNLVDYSTIDSRQSWM
jgi:hypothetical protein